MNNEWVRSACPAAFTDGRLRTPSKSPAAGGRRVGPVYIRRTPVFTALLVLVAMLGSPTPAGGSMGPEPVLLDISVLDRWFSVAQDQHPSIRAVSSRVDAAGSDVRAVPTWPDPELTVGGLVSSSRGPDREAEGDLRYGASQALPLFGKAAAARAVARAAVGVAEATRSYEMQLLRRDLVAQTFRLAEVDRVLELRTADLKWLEGALSLQRERYRAGAATPEQVLALESEFDITRTELRSLQARRPVEASAWNSLMGYSLAAAVPAFRMPAAAPEVPISARLLELASRSEPRLRWLARELEQAKAEREAARKSKYPEVRVGVEGTQYSGDGRFREGFFSLGVSVPWANRSSYRHREEARAYGVTAAERLLESHRRTVEQEVRRVVQAAEAARQTAVVFSTRVIPRNRTAYEATHASWRGGTGSSLEVLQARRTLLSSERTLVEALSEQYRMLAELVTCCGIGELDALRQMGLSLEPVEEEITEPNR